MKKVGLFLFLIGFGCSKDLKFIMSGDVSLQDSEGFPFQNIKIHFENEELNNYDVYFGGVESPVIAILPDQTGLIAQVPFFYKDSPDFSTTIRMVDKNGRDFIVKESFKVKALPKIIGTSQTTRDCFTGPSYVETILVRNADYFKELKVILTNSFHTDTITPIYRSSGEVRIERVLRAFDSSISYISILGVPIDQVDKKNSISYVTSTIWLENYNPSSEHPRFDTSIDQGKPGDTIIVYAPYHDDWRSGGGFMFNKTRLVPIFSSYDQNLKLYIDSFKIPDLPPGDYKMVVAVYDEPKYCVHRICDPEFEGTSCHIRSGIFKILN